MKYKLFCILNMLFVATTLHAADHSIAMKNAGTDGPMVFEPAVIKVAVGDTVTFEPVDASHNSESIPGLTPEGSVVWKGEMNQAVTVTIDKEGVYVYQCLPHAMMAMVGVIVAGEPTNLEKIKKDSAALTGKFVMNKERLENYLSQVIE